MHPDCGGLLLGTPIGNAGLLAVGWCVVISVIGYFWAIRLYERNPAAWKEQGV